MQGRFWERSGLFYLVSPEVKSPRKKHQKQTIKPAIDRMNLLAVMTFAPFSMCQIHTHSKPMNCLLWTLCSRWSSNRNQLFNITDAQSTTWLPIVVPLAYIYKHSLLLVCMHWVLAFIIFLFWFKVRTIILWYNCHRSCILSSSQYFYLL